MASSTQQTSSARSAGLNGQAAMTNVSLTLLLTTNLTRMARREPRASICLQRAVNSGPLRLEGSFGTPTRSPTTVKTATGPLPASVPMALAAEDGTTLPTSKTLSPSPLARNRRRRRKRRIDGRERRTLTLSESQALRLGRNPRSEGPPPTTPVSIPGGTARRRSSLRMLKVDYMVIVGVLRQRNPRTGEVTRTISSSMSSENLAVVPNGMYYITGYPSLRISSPISPQRMLY